MKYLTEEHLKTLPTIRLLTYYKKIRRKIRRHENSLYCPCCGAPNYTIDAKCFTKEENKRRKHEFETDIEESENYLKLVKKILNTREHVER